MFKVLSDDATIVSRVNTTMTDAKEPDQSAEPTTHHKRCFFFFGFCLKSQYKELDYKYVGGNQFGWKIGQGETTWTRGDSLTSETLCQKP